MNIDLQEVFDQAGRNAPRSTLDRDLIMRTGRRLKLRHRAVVSATTVLSVGLVAVGAAALVNNTPAPKSSPTAISGAVGGSESSTPTASNGPTAIPTTPADGPRGPYPYSSPPPDLVAVTLPDPAPGFPYRQNPGSPLIGFSLNNSSTDYWGASFQVATRPPGTTVYGPGVFQEVNIDVSHGPLPPLTPDGTIDGAKVTGTLPVAGVTGYLTTWTEKGGIFHDLYFTTARFSVRLIGTDAVTTTQLVTLAESLTNIR
jgi:hypothetical protein